MSIRVQIRRDLAAAWTSADPVLAQGEMGYETDTGKLKFGDGSTVWTSLIYFDATSLVLSTRGDIVVRDVSNVTNRLAVGTSGQALYSDGFDVLWDDVSPLALPLSTRGDILVRDSGNVNARLGIGTSGEILSSDGTDISWEPTKLIGFSDLDNKLVIPAYRAWISASTSSVSALPSSDGTTVILTVEGSGGGNFDICLSTGFTEVVCTPPLTATLSHGSDISPTLNYAFISSSTPTVVTTNTTGFPTTEEFHPVGTYLVQSAASVLTYGVYKAHNWTDHIKNTISTNGHIAHMGKWIRSQQASWSSGVALTPTLTAIGPDTLTIETSSGVVLQLHDHVMPAFDSSTVGSTAATTFFVVNDNGAAYTPGKDLFNFKSTEAGVAAGKNDRISWIVWGVVSEATNDCKIMINLPGGFYGSDATAISDSLKHSNYNIPAQYIGTGFLIAKLTYNYDTSGGGILTLVENVDLRGQLPSVFAGGSAGVATEFIDNTFKITDDLDSTKILEFQNSGITTATTRTLTVPDASGIILIAKTPTAVTDTYTTLATDNTITANKATPFTITMVTASGNGGTKQKIKKIGVGVVTISFDGVETGDGLTEYILYTTNDWIEFQSDGTNWIIVDDNRSGSYVLANVTTTEAITTGGQQLLVFGTTTADIKSEFSSGTFTAKESGFYEVSPIVSWAYDATGYRLMFVIFNGDATRRDYRDSGVGIGPFHSVCITRWLNVGETIEIKVQHNKGSDLNVDASTELMIKQVRGR